MKTRVHSLYILYNVAGSAPSPLAYCEHNFHEALFWFDISNVVYHFIVLTRIWAKTQVQLTWSTVYIMADPVRLVALCTK